LTEAVPVAPPRASRGHRLALLAITAAACAWRVATLGAESLWYDEAISLHLARLPLHEILEDRARDGHPPPYFLLLHMWVHLFGDSPEAIRSLSVVPGTLLVPLLYLVAARRHGPVAGLLAAGLAAGSRVLSHYSQEARDYAFLVLLSTLSFWALDRARERPSAGRLAAWSLALAATLWSSVFGIAIFVVQTAWLAGLGVAARTRRGAGPRPGVREAVPWLLAAGAAALLFSPWAAVLARRAETAPHDLWVTAPSPEVLVEAAAALGGSRRGLALLLPAVAVGLVTVLGRRAPDRPRGFLLLAWLVGPVLLPFVASHLAFPVYVRRGTIAAAGAFVVLAAVGLDALRPRRRAFLAVAALALVAVGYGAFRQVDRRDKEDWRGLARLLAERAAPHDVVLVRNDYERVAHDAYGDRDDLLFSTHADAAAGRILWGEQPRVWLVVSPHAREAHAAREGLRAAGFTLREAARAPMIDLEGWGR
jgi:4-amino-4-deoxy-L-arabinose transferase-like glycosyltransferase